jgi:hypothetical protein
MRRAVASNAAVGSAVGTLGWLVKAGLGVLPLWSARKVFGAAAPATAAAPARANGVTARSCGGVAAAVYQGYDARLQPPSGRDEG